MYQALYRQYRPKTFDEVLGQKHITNILKNQILKGNIGHAYLFSGTRGTGKTSTAKIFSRAVNCLKPEDGNPCNECEICKGILDESIMDVIEMDAASNRKIDDIRELKDKVIYPPSRAKYKVYIIDEVHMLTTEAFNALLKTLEEPPKHLIFILATTEPQKLPQTILSRCQRFDFKRITTKDIIENMKNICNNLKIDIDEEVLRLIARNTDGAMRDALSLLEQCLSFGEGKVTYEDAISILGIVNFDTIFDIVDNIIDKKVEKTLELINQVIENGKDIHQFIKDFIYHFRNLMIVKTTKDPNTLIEVEESLLEKYIKQTNSIDINFILRSLDILTTADEKAKWSSQPRIILELASIQLAKLGEELSLEERVKRLEMGIRIENTGPTKVDPRKMETPPIDKTPKTIAETPIKKSEEKPAKPIDIQEEEEVFEDSGEDISFEQIKEDWGKILQSIRSRKMNIYALLIEGQPISFTNNILTVGYKDGFGFHKEAISAPHNNEFVEKAISSYYKKNISVKFTMVTEKPVVKKEEKQDKDKAIKEVLDFFGEDIVEIK
ncbi:MAG: DNA polymerase III subunit gamma/tau [Tissierellia bacterium]|nr:DNA polymerase III subunit gamma/tau [Tissierellia bacterium]